MTTMWDHLRRSALLLTGVACMILTTAGAAAGQAAGAAAGQDPFEGVARADVLLLGTFHFDDPVFDDYKPQFPWDPFSPEHQREIEEVVELLAHYGPTRIALEWPANRQAELDSLYTAYLAGAITLRANEREQLGFRLARRLGHDRVYAVDVPGRSYFPEMTEAGVRVTRCAAPSGCGSRAPGAAPAS